MIETEHIKEIIAKKLTFGLRSMVSKSFLDDITVDVEYDYQAERMLIAVQTKILGKDIRQETQDTFSYPTTWKDAVKDRFTPKWLRKHIKINYTTKNTIVHHYHLCPHIELPSKRRNEYVHLAFLAGDEE